MGSTIVCPDCASTEIRPSSSKNPWERIYALSGFKPYFCENCYLRFFAKLTSAGPGDDERDDFAEVRTQGPRVRPAYVVFALAVIVAIGLGLGLLQTGGQAPRPEAAAESGQTGVKPLPKLAQADQPAPEPPAAETAVAQAVKPPTPQPISRPTSPPPTPQPTVTRAAPTTAPPPPPSKAKQPALVKPAPAKPVAPASGKAYTIQLGAFTTMDKAAKFQSGLTKKGLATRVDRVINPDGKLWFKVRLGVFSTRAEAKQAMARVAEQSGLKPYITTK